jgi:hypothetical protein
MTGDVTRLRKVANSRSSNHNDLRSMAEMLGSIAQPHLIAAIQYYIPSAFEKTSCDLEANTA